MSVTNKIYHFLNSCSISNLYFLKTVEKISEANSAPLREFEFVTGVEIRSKIGLEVYKIEFYQVDSSKNRMN